MNTTVQATGMSVTAKSDQVFLMIKEGYVANPDTIQEGKLIIDTATNSSAVLLPAAHKLGSSATSTTLDAVTGANMTNWYWKTSDDPALYGGDGHESEQLNIESSAIGQYVLVNEFSFTVADGSNAISSLTVSNIKVTTADGKAQAVKVIVASATASEEFGNTSSSGIAGSVNLLAENLDSDHVAHVKIYIYWDGNNAAVYTNNIGNLVGTSVEVSFTGVIAPAA